MVIFGKSPVFVVFFMAIASTKQSLQCNHHPILMA